MITNNMPKFYLLGFQRCGTSTIHNWLSQSNIISLPKIKETHFYSNEELYNKGTKWYLKQFSKDRNHIIRGEVDPSYILLNDNLLKIKNDNNNDLKFIFIFRRPIDRSYSHFLLSKYRGYEKETFLKLSLQLMKKLKNSQSYFP